MNFGARLRRLPQAARVAGQELALPAPTRQGPQPFADLHIEATPWGPVWRRQQTYSLDGGVGAASFAATWEAKPQALGALDTASGRAATPLVPSELLFLDTETTGLQGGAGTVPFLVGYAYFARGALVLEQLFLPQLGRERALLWCVAERVKAHRTLVSYNGKSYDWPLLRSRFVLANLEAPALQRHVDLVHACRRLVRGSASFRLVAMEERVLGYKRTDDLPGAEVPEAYFSYLRHGRAHTMCRVLQHNGEDILAMVALMGALAPRLEDGGHACLTACERLAVARSHLRQQDPTKALEVALTALPLACATDAVEIALFCAELQGRGEKVGEAARRLAHTALRFGGATPATTLARAHLWLSKRYACVLNDLARAQMHAARTYPAESHALQAKRLYRLALRAAQHAKQSAEPAVSAREVPLVQQDDRPGFPTSWAPVQKVGLLSLHAQKRILNPVTRNEHVVRENGNPGAGVAVPRPRPVF